MTTSLEDRLSALEASYEMLRDQHLALLSLTLALLPAKKLGREGIDALFMLAHQNAGVVLSAGGTDDSVKQAVSESIDLLNELVRGQV